jgi:hypothetical protein
MEEKKKAVNDKKMLRGCFFFFIGFAVGVGLMVSIFLINRFLPEGKQYVASISKAAFADEDTSVAPFQEFEDKTIVSQGIVPKLEKEISDEELALLDSLDDMEFPALDYEDVEFSIDMEIPEEIQLFDQIVRSRRIAIIDRSVDVDSLHRSVPPYSSLDVQQWSTPIRNSVTYNRERNILKIKGMDIDGVEIFYRNGEYYLQYKNNNYPIPVNDSFERLVEKPMNSKP